MARLRSLFIEIENTKAQNLLDFLAHGTVCRSGKEVRLHVT